MLSGQEEEEDPVEGYMKGQPEKEEPGKCPFFPILIMLFIIMKHFISNNLNIHL